jgi:hypothetical protein
MRPWLKGLATVIVPDILRDIAVVEKDRVNVPVPFLTRQKGTTLQEQNAFARGGQTIRQCAAASTRANNDHVIVFHSRFFLQLFATLL